MLGAAPHLDGQYTVFGEVVQVGAGGAEPWHAVHPACTSRCLRTRPDALPPTCSHCRLAQGNETLARLEGLETKREGIFVMPLERISILATYM